MPRGWVPFSLSGLQQRLKQTTDPVYRHEAMALSRWANVTLFQRLYKSGRVSIFNARPGENKVLRIRKMVNFYGRTHESGRMIRLLTRSKRRE